PRPPPPERRKPSWHNPTKRLRITGELDARTTPRTANAMTATAPSVAPAAAEAVHPPRRIAAPALAVLAENPARLLAFRGNRAGESAVAWFYRLLRNALADHRRRCAAERRALAAYAGEAAAGADDDRSLLEAVCGCVTGLVATLKPELAEIVRGVDLDGVPLR